MTARPTNTDLREKLMNKISEIILFDFYQRVMKYPRGKTISVEPEAEKIMHLLDTYAAQMCREARIDELMAAEKYASYGVVAEDRWQMFGVYKQDRLTQLKREDGDE